MGTRNLSLCKKDGELLKKYSLDNLPTEQQFIDELEREEE